ncbi:biopolymer transporter ExbD [Halioxenophilus sp. WMMB6]|uniref:ExbD/TolR family protein n=1 Tax=Halioxenophilus sp. WMMB6 TaxID=3073815 RepID=UPI00295E29CA|nr:biopolymer transporter ExbD [Halioxenophilus sp. WMMB6]
MKFKRQNREEDSINLTPLIDVVFLLLIFFMVSTTFTKETHLTVDLPEAVANPSTDQPKQIDVVIARDGTFSVNGSVLVNRKIDTLRRAITEVAEGDNTRPLIITADSNTPHQAVVTVMDVAGRLGFVHLSIATKQPVDPDAAADQ